MNVLTKTSFVLITMLVAITLNAQEVDFVPGQLLIKIKDGAKTQKISLSTQMKATTLKNFSELNIELWEVNQANGKQATLDLIEQYKNHPNVEFVEPNYIMEAVNECPTPKDPYFPQLWGLHNTGQNEGTSDADIDLLEAYCILGSAINIVVGVIDSGVDYTHEDLAENIWQNLGEDADGDGKVLIKSGNNWVFDPGDKNGIDDDGNGYVDDFVGWDFIYDDNNPMDGLSGHGTHCAGTIGARANNNVGVAGVATNVQIAALKFLNDNIKASGPTSAAIEALNYAVAMNMPITNNSWGGGGYSAALYQALQIAEANNHLFIVAAGNGGSDNIGDNNDLYPHYPASYDNPNIISVANTDKNDILHTSSNYGLASVDIAAPGTRIFSCLPKNKYGNKSGTSMSTPHVVGVSAIVLGTNPGSSYSIIKDALISSVDPLPSLNGKIVSGGRVNLHNALVEMGANPCAADCGLDDPYSGQHPCVKRDSTAMRAIYDATEGPNWSNSWDPDIPLHDQWIGIVRFNENGCVKELKLINDNLVGTLPNELGDLKDLEWLQIIENDNLEGNIPPEIGNLLKLKALVFWLIHILRC